MAPSRRWVSICVRAVLLAVLAAMLARVSLVRRTEALAVIALVDVSGSTRRFYDGGNDAVLARTRSVLASIESERGPDDLLGVIAFGSRAIAVATPTIGPVSERSLDLPLSTGTNIADAIRLGRSLIPPDAAGRLLLLSDGHQTAGDAVAAAGTGGGTSVDILPLLYSLDREVILERVDAPPSAAAGAVVSVRVLLSSAGDSTGTLRLTANDIEVDLNGDAPGAGRRIELRPGRTIEQMQVRLDDRRVHRFRAVFEPDPEPGDVPRFSGDTIAENNSGEAFTLTPGRGTILLADGVSRENDDSGRTVAEALTASGFTVLTIPPDGLPGDVLRLQEHDLVILEDVPAEVVPEATQRALAAYVQDLGGGLLFIGGPNSFGAGGWKGSVLEPIMPVRLDLPERLITPEAAIIFVLDNSGSMWRSVLGSDKTQQEIANDAAALAVRSLDARDLVGIITFNSEPEELIPLAPNSKPGESAALIRGILSGGGTNAPPALRLARDRLSKSAAKVRHIVFLSDGKSRGTDQLVPLAREMADEGIKLTAIAVGDDADLVTLRRMAEQGGGAYHHALNPNTLPQLFLKAVRIVRTPLIREEPFEPVILGGGSPITVGLPPPPPLGGLALTQPRAEPTVVNAITTPRGEPVLAHWQVGLGQSVAFTSDASRWAEAWLPWEGYQQFWSQVARTASRSATAGQGLTASAFTEPGVVRLRLDAADSDGRPRDGLSVPATVYTPSGSAREVNLTQIGPGIYETSIPTDEVGSFVAVMKPASSETRLPPVIAGATLLDGPEFRAMSSDLSLLREISRRSGGRELSPEAATSRTLFDRGGIPPREAVLPLWPILLWWTLGLVLLDIATRRIAWDRWFSRRFIGDIAEHAAAAAREKTDAATRTLAGLRARAADPAPDGPSLALGEREAEMLAAAARDQRRAARLASLTNSSPGTPAKTEDGPPADGGLLAAKRRAAKRFEEDRPQ